MAALGPQCKSLGGLAPGRFENACIVEDERLCRRNSSHSVPSSALASFDFGMSRARMDSRRQLDRAHGVRWRPCVPCGDNRRVPCVPRRSRMTARFELRRMQPVRQDWEVGKRLHNRPLSSDHSPEQHEELPVASHLAYTRFCAQCSEKCSWPLWAHLQVVARSTPLAQSGNPRRALVAYPKGGGGDDVSPHLHHGLDLHLLWVTTGDCTSTQASGRPPPFRSLILMIGARSRDELHRSRQLPSWVAFSACLARRASGDGHLRGM